MGAQCNFPGDSNGKESACSVGDSGLILELGGSPVEGNDNPLQYSCPENSMDKGAWWLQSLARVPEWLTHKTHTHTHSVISRVFWRETQEGHSQRGMWRCYHVGSGDPGKDHEPRDIGNLQKLERQADGSSPRASGGSMALLSPWPWSRETHFRLWHPEVYDESVLFPPPKACGNLWGPKWETLKEMG